MIMNREAFLLLTILVSAALGFFAGAVVVLRIVGRGRRGRR